MRKKENMTKAPSISLFLILIIFILLSSSHSNTNVTDFEALLLFKKSLLADPLQALSSWNETTNLCEWNGVSCGGLRHPNRVVSLSLISQGLVGPLSPHIGNLSFLRTIILQNNTFHGTIPPQIGGLSRLRILILSNNSFGGGIPTNLSRCRSLYRMDLIDNELTGPIPPEIGSLAKLDNLALSKNKLSGTVPPSLGNLTSVTLVSLGVCGLQGEIPESLAQLGKLQWLILRENGLSGSIPLGLYNLSSLEVLDLGSNQLYGTLPPSFTLPNLSHLNLAENHFSGPLRASLFNTSMVVNIYMYSNNFTGNMIDLTGYSALEYLDVGSNSLEGDVSTILTSLINSTFLHDLGLYDNLFTGSLPDSIGNLSTRLFALDIGANQLSGGIPSSIGNLVSIAALVTETNNLGGPIPSSIGKLDKLQIISFRQNRLTGEVPASFGNLTLLNHLYLDMNDLSGSLPPSFGNCSNLLSLVLSYNSINGSIPPVIMRLSSISMLLDLANNFLIGPIPSEVGALRNLGELDLSDNMLSGTIPTSLSSCLMLSWLDLGGNSLRGEIPDESLRSLRGLEHLDLSRNNFSGTIPTFLGEFHLLYLNLSFNVLWGKVPSLGVFQNGSAVSLQGNRGLCGGNAILNLPPCPSPPPYHSNKRRLGKILIPAAAGAVCLALALCLCFYVIVYRRRRTKNDGATVEAVAPEFLRLSYADLLSATAGFSEASLVGAGRFGSVYRGNILKDDDELLTDLAVKVLNLDVRGASKSLASECNALRCIRHRNLLKILSVCDGTDFRGNDFKALVYEFMTNGSLENWLHQSSEEHGRKLSFSQRLNIAIDIASAVEYLHGGTDTIVIHGDLKPSNILLDQDMVAHVGDFGLAKVISDNFEATSISTAGIKGTIGYIAPEYGMNDVVSTQGDAYSYGVVLLEMFTDIRPTSSDAFHGYANLRDFVLGALPNRAGEVVDPFLRPRFNEGDECWDDSVVSILRIGVKCSMELPRDRMSMAEVVNDLKKIRSAFPGR